MRRHLGVIGQDDARCNGDSVRATADHLSHVVEVYASDGNQWNDADTSLDLADHFRSFGSLGVFFRSRGKNGADGDVVGALFDGPGCLLNRVSGNAQEHLPWHKVPRRNTGKIVLSDMYAVGGDSKCNIKVIVHEEGNAKMARNGKEHYGTFVILALGEPFGTKLNSVGSPCARPFQRVVDMVEAEKAFIKDYI